MASTREAAESDGDENKVLYSLVLASIIDPDPIVRLAAVRSLRERYDPEVRSVEVIDDLVIINTRTRAGEYEPFSIGLIPNEYEGKKPELLPWDMDGDLAARSPFYKMD